MLFCKIFTSDLRGPVRFLVILLFNLISLGHNLITCLNSLIISWSHGDPLLFEILTEMITNNVTFRVSETPHSFSSSSWRTSNAYLMFWMTSSKSGLRDGITQSLQFKGKNIEDLFWNRNYFWVLSRILNEKILMESSIATCNKY